MCELRVLEKRSEENDTLLGHRRVPRFAHARDARCDALHFGATFTAASLLVVFHQHSCTTLEEQPFALVDNTLGEKERKI